MGMDGDGTARSKLHCLVFFSKENVYHVRSKINRIDFKEYSEQLFIVTLNIIPLKRDFIDI